MENPTLPLGEFTDVGSFAGPPIRRTRGRFELHSPPVRAMSTAGRPRASVHVDCPEEVREVASALHQISWARERARWALRDALDDLFDGARTGRWCYQHLTPMEQRSLSTRVLITLAQEFQFHPGDELTWNVAGHEVECSFAVDAGGWELPMSTYRCVEHGDRSARSDGTAMLVWLNEEANEWAIGLTLVTDAMLRWKIDKATGEPVRAYGRDNHRRISEDKLAEIFWLWGGVQDDLPENTLLHMLPQRRASVFADDSSGQRRVDQLFRVALGEIVRKPTVQSVAQQDDAPKRVRDARKKLKPEGIVILGHQESHPLVAKHFRLAVPDKGEWISVRLIPVEADDTRPVLVLGGRRWAVARSDERSSTEAPELPKVLPAGCLQPSWTRDPPRASAS